MVQTTAGRTLVISIPYPRLLKVVLSEIDRYIANYEAIHIISPFEISGAKGKFQNIVYKFRRPVLDQVLRVYEYLRRFGFFYKHKHYFVFETNKIGTAKKCDENYKNFQIWRYVVFFMFTRLGSNTTLLKILRRSLVVFSAILFIKLDKFLRSLPEFDYIHLCQSGPQDTILSFLVPRHKINAISFFSISTDECMNGFLLFEKYSSVVLQGPFERRLYNQIHGQQSANKLTLRKSSPPRLEPRLERNLILIAGASSMFYPACEELKVVRMLYDFFARKFPKKIIVYRPLIDGFKNDETFNSFFEGRPIDIRPPSKVLTAVQYSDVITLSDLHEDQREYIKLLRATDLVISAFQTSLLLDAAFYGAKVCSFAIDSTGYSERVGIQSYTGFKIFEGVPLYSDEESLLDALSSYPLIENNLLLENWSSWWLPSQPSEN